MSNVGSDGLWTLVTQFGDFARARHVAIEEAILRHLEAEVARHQAASQGLVDPCLPLDGDRELAMAAGAIYRERMETSEAPTLDERVAYLARLHDLVVTEDRDGDRRASRAPIAPALDGLLDVAWSLLVLEEDVARIRVDLQDKGACRAAEYFAEVHAAWRS